jgi:hypothetical protein
MGCRCVRCFRSISKILHTEFQNIPRVCRDDGGTGETERGGEREKRKDKPLGACVDWTLFRVIKLTICPNLANILWRESSEVSGDGPEKMWWWW